MVGDGPCLSVGGAHVSSPGRWEVGEARVLHPGSFRVQLFPASFCLGFGRAGPAPTEEDPSTVSELPALRGQSPITTIVPSAASKEESFWPAPEPSPPRQGGQGMQGRRVATWKEEGSGRVAGAGRSPVCGSGGDGRRGALSKVHGR